MTLSPLAKFANSPSDYKKLCKWVDAHNKASENIDTDILYNPIELEKAILSALDNSIKKFLK